MFAQRFPLTVRAAVVLALSVVAVPLARPGAQVAPVSACGSYCSATCDDQWFRAAYCAGRFGGTCGIGSTCQSFDTRCGTWEVAIDCLGNNVE